MRNEYAAVIYDRFNVIVKVEERPTAERAMKAGEFWTRVSGWYKIVSGADDIEMYKAMINM